jgi:hypothetical protein
LEDWVFRGDGGFFDWRECDFLTAAARTVGLCDDGGDFEVWLREQMLEAWDCE